MGRVFNMVGGGGKAPAPVGRSDVNFYDYDGSIVASYTAADFANLSALPKNPTHDGLTAQGWNYTLADAKAYVASYGKLDVGQMYITDDGKTRIYIKLEEGRLAPYLGIAINGTATVEWGDGQTSTVTGSSTTTVVSTQHTYASAGEYVIKIATSGSMALMGADIIGSQVLWKNTITVGSENRAYQSAIKKIEIGANTDINTNAFHNCFSLASVIIPNSVTSIGELAFRFCYSLASVVIPDNVTSIGNNAFNGCHFLTSVVIPNSVTRIGANLFNECRSLASVVIPDSVMNVGGSVFYNCYSLESVIIPNNVASFGTNMFYGCLSLAHIVIPNNVTSIGAYAFYNCYSLASVVIPDNVTSIGNNAFQNCNGLGSIKFTGMIPPAVGNSYTWNGVPTDCIIYIPRGALSAYTTASKYPSSSTYTYVEYDP